VSISRNYRSRPPERASGTGVLRELSDSWRQLHSLWRVGRAHEDPLASPNAATSSLERATRALLVGLLNSTDEEAEDLFAAARAIRDEHVGTRIDMRAAIDVGNVCRVNCHYCPMRRDNLHSTAKKGPGTITAYRADSDKIVEVSEHAYQLGFRELFLQSGEDSRLVPQVIEGVEAVMDAHPDFNITLNLGALANGEYAKLREAGARNFLIKHETANPILHEQQREETLRHRVDHMIKAREAGFEIGSGNILGLPNQTDEDLADDVLFLGRFNITKMVSCAPFTPSDELPEDARNAAPGDFDKTRRFVALLRLCFPDARIPAVSNADSPLMPRRQQGKSGQALFMDAGANGITVNFTPPEWEANYGLYERGSSKTYLVSLKKAQQVAAETGLSTGKIGASFE
jgi:biotin synthase